jgi:hypothetical protein
VLAGGGGAGSRHRVELAQARRRRAQDERARGLHARSPERGALLAVARRVRASHLAGRLCERYVRASRRQASDRARTHNQLLCGAACPPPPFAALMRPPVRLAAPPPPLRVRRPRPRLVAALSGRFLFTPNTKLAALSPRYLRLMPLMKAPPHRHHRHCGPRHTHSHSLSTRTNERRRPPDETLLA